MAIDQQAVSYNDFLSFAEPRLVNPDLDRLQPDPFEKLRQLFAAVSPAPSFGEIKLSIDDLHHETPAFIKYALADPHRYAVPDSASDCAVIVKRGAAQTRAKSEINELLRD